MSVETSYLRRVATGEYETIGEVGDALREAADEIDDLRKQVDSAEAVISACYEACVYHSSGYARDVVVAARAHFASYPTKPKDGG